MLVTRMLRDSRIAAREAAAMPFPREETTPPVTKTYFGIYPARVGMEKFIGMSLDLHPVCLDPVVGTVHGPHILAHRPGDHLPVERHVVDLGVVLGQSVGHQLFSLRRVGLHA